MKIHIHLILVLLIFEISFSKIYAQDIQFSQFYAASSYLNPAFVGSAQSLRGTFHQRVQWPALDAKYITSMFSADNYFSKYKSGFGIMVMQDYQGSNIVKSSDVTAQYSYMLPLNKNYTLRSGIQLGYVSRFINYSNLIFPDQYNNQGYAGATNDNIFGHKRINYMDVSSGGLLHSEIFWFGFSAHHLNRPNQSFLGEVSNLPVKYSFVTGYKIVVSEKSEYSKSGQCLSFVPTAHYKFQGMSDQLDLGIYSLYNQIIFGLWYRGIPIKKYNETLRNNESMVLLGGCKFKSLSMSYSYDFLLSRLSSVKNWGAHEINLTYLYKKSKNSKPTRRLPCPRFYEF